MDENKEPKPEYFYVFDLLPMGAMLCAVAGIVVGLIATDPSEIGFWLVLLGGASGVWLFSPFASYMAIEADAMITRRGGMVSVIKFDNVLGFGKHRSDHQQGHTLLYQDGEKSRRMYLFEHRGRTGLFSDRLNMALAHHRAGGEAKEEDLRRAIARFNSTAYFDDNSFSSVDGAL